MNDLSRPAFAKLFEALCERFGRNVNEVILESYYRRLVGLGLSAAQVTQAVMDIICSSDHQYFPECDALILQIAGPALEQSAQEQWRLAYYLISGGDPNAVPIDEWGARALNDLGNLQVLGRNTEDHTQTIVKAAFIRDYVKERLKTTAGLNRLFLEDGQKRLEGQQDE